MNNLNTDNSKKLIIGISIIFCAIVLVVGTSLAFFTQSDSKEIGNVVTENINGTLKFYDNNDYMLDNLIPVNEEDVIKFASKSIDKCKYQEGMYACNLYEFTITNDSNVTQELKITLNPTKNEFSNLYYMLFESNKDNITSDMMSVNKEQIVETNSNIMVDKLLLGPKQSKTYTVVYYVLNLKDIDQTSMDANKQFYASVRVDSITTGTYAGTLMESRCYEYEEITQGEYNGTYKLTKFNGIDENGIADTTCGVTKNGDFYSVTVPSKLKDEEGNELEISTLGNRVFIGLDFVNFSNTPNYLINNIVIEDEIEVIEDGEELDSYTFVGAFAFMGWDMSSGFSQIDNYELSIKLPKNLIYLGNYSFNNTKILSLSIPSQVKTIGAKLITSGNVYLENLIFEGALDGTSKLTDIGESAFSNSKIESLVIPFSVKRIADGAFGSCNNLKSLTFMGTDNNSSLLWSIGDRAFYEHSLEYGYDNPLILPGSLTYIGDWAFDTDSIRLDYFSNVLFMGSRENLDKLGTSWYSSKTIITAIDD